MNEGLSEIRIALDLDPLSRVINLNLARILHFARQFDDAIRHCRKTIEMYPEYLIAHRRLGISYGEKGMFEEAEAEFKKALAISENESETMSARAYAYAGAGRTEDDGDAGWRDEARGEGELLVAAARARETDVDVEVALPCAVRRGRLSSRHVAPSAC